MNLARGGWLIVLTLIAAFLLTMMRAPLVFPEWLGWLRPGWIVLVVFYWTMRLPHRFGLIGAWVTGLFADALYVDPLGLNGLVLAVITYIAWRLHQRLRMYSVLQQAGVAALMVLLSEAARRVAHSQLQPWFWAMLLPAATSMILWPFLYTLLEKFSQRFRVE